MIRFDSEGAQKELVEEILNEWFSYKKTILDAHEQRLTNTKNAMIHSIELYEKLLTQVSLTNEFHVNELKQYEVLPLNGEERYSFIIGKPDNYAAYCQLDELFEETRKRIARLRLKNK